MGKFHFGPIRALAWVTATAFACAGASAAVLTVGPPSETAGCAYPTIQAAIDAAAASPGLDIIRIARGTYPAQHLLINDNGDLAIEGGFVSCQTLVHADYSTLDGYNSPQPGPVIEERSHGNLTLSDLHIQNADATRTGATTGVGGGVAALGRGLLTIRRSVFSGNRAVLGGGLFVGTGTGYVKQVDLDGVTFANNTATHSGGGLYADQADVHITGEKASSFTGNSAMGTTDDNGGGALYAMNSNVHITAAMNPTVAFMDGNWASASGGAIFLRAAVGKSAWFSLIAPQGSGAPVITSNSATYLGGAIYVNAIGDGSTAQVVLFDTIIANNLAPQASAVQLYAGGNTQTRATLNMYANPFSSPCNVIQRCNRISGNQSGDYGTVVAETSGQARTVFQMDQGHLVNNITVNFGGLVDNIGPGNDTWINNSVIADNDFGNAPLATASGQFQINNTTIARNNRVSPAVIRSYGAPITFHNNLVFQPEAPLLASSGGADVNLCNLMVGNLTGLDNLVARNIQYTTDPVFVNAGQGDYRIQVGSQARNRYASTGCASVAHEDLLGATRPDRPDLPTPYDMGAYEYGAVVDHLFNDSFDGEVASRPASP